MTADSPTRNRRRSAVLAGAAVITLFASTLCAAWGLPWGLRWAGFRDGQGAFLYLEIWLVIPLVAGAGVGACRMGIVMRAVLAATIVLGSVVGVSLNMSWTSAADVAFVGLLWVLAAVATCAGIGGGAFTRWIVGWCAGSQDGRQAIDRSPDRPADE